MNLYFLEVYTQAIKLRKKQMNDYHKSLKNISFVG